jgi:hypothetical protein
MASPSTTGAPPEYDAFLSYSNHDGRVVGRIQRFLESYRVRRDDGSKQRLQVFLDQTDIRGGEPTSERATSVVAVRGRSVRTA